MYRSIIFTAAAALSAATAVYAAPSGADSSAKSADPGDQIVCRRYNETGSLVGTIRTCKTRREWNRDADSIRPLSSSDSCRNTGNGGQC